MKIEKKEVPFHGAFALDCIWMKILIFVEIDTVKMNQLYWVAVFIWAIHYRNFTVMQSHVLHVSVYFVSNSACVCGWDIYQYRRSVLCLKLLSLHCSWIEHRLDQSYKYSLRHTHTHHKYTLTLSLSSVLSAKPD